MSHKFPYKWNIADGYPAKGIEKNNLNVFGTFICGGGSTMGYKLAGFNHLGGVEIDPPIADVYKENHNPKYLFLQDIRDFNKRTDLPTELYSLDFLDGSPPCSSFSLAGNRGKDWGKEKKFREGQAKQVLDTLFFDFIDLAKKLQPKIVIAENVKGLLLGSAKEYVKRIYTELDLAGYHTQHFLLDASKMGVPQRRERVFFIGIRKDLAENYPILDLEFNEEPIIFDKVLSDDSDRALIGRKLQIYNGVNYGEPDLRYSYERLNGKQSYFGYKLIYGHKVANTILANDCNVVFGKSRHMNIKELCLCGTYPIDYNFIKNKVHYLVGMSVPPVMTAQIATRIHQQWLSKIK